MKRRNNRCQLDYLKQSKQMAKKEETNLEMSTFQDVSVISLNESVSPLKLVQTQSFASAKSETEGGQESPNKGRSAKKSETIMTGLRDNLEFMNIFKKADKKKHEEQETSRDKEINSTKINMRRTDTLAAILALISAIICFIENEQFYDDEIAATGTIDTSVSASNKENILRGVIIVFTIALCVCVYLHYAWKLRLLKLQKLKLPEDTIKTSGLLWKLVAELILCAICTPPYFDYTVSGTALGGTYIYSWDAIVSVIMLLKSYLVLRLFGQYSEWTSPKAIRTCKKYKAKATITFAIKAELKSRPYLILGIFFIITLVYLGVGMRTFEKSFSLQTFNFDYVSNALWVTVITMTTVGFGDGYPKTHLGRFIGVMACMIGMLLISLMVVSMTIASDLSLEESKAYFAIKKTKESDKSKERAANVIKTLFNLRKAARTKTVQGKAETFIWVVKLQKNVAIYKDDYRVANSINLPLDEMMKTLHNKSHANISRIKKEISAIGEIEKRCSDLKERQQRVCNKMDDIIRMQGSLADFLIKINKTDRNGNGLRSINLVN